jgi:glyoxylase I family protein
MTNPISTGAVHHLTLTVTDMDRARDFYTNVLGFQVATEFGPRVLLSNGSVLLALTPPPDPAQAPGNDRFNENRVGLDHLSFAVESRDDLERAAHLLDERGVSRGEIKDLGPGFGIYVMAFRDPDNIQLELTAPYS